MGKDLKGKELGVGISQRKDGMYTARFTDRFGKRKQQYFKKLQECRNWIAQAQFEDEHSDINSMGDMSVSAWFNYWVENIKSNNIKPQTIQNYTNRFKINVKPCIGEMLLANVKQMHCQNVLNIMANKGYCKSTIGLTNKTMRTLFDSAVENGIILKNPVSKKTSCNNGADSKPERVLSIDEQRKFMCFIKNNPRHNQYALALQTGIRVGELTALTWEDVDFDNKLLRIRKTAGIINNKWNVGTPKSKSGIRDIPLTDEAIAVLKNQKEKLRSLKISKMEYRNYVFVTKNGNLIQNSAYYKNLESICKKIGIERISMHTLRHTFATRCAEAGMQPKTLQTILGHSDINTTMSIYVHCTADRKRKEMSGIAKALKVV